MPQHVIMLVAPPDSGEEPRRILTRILDCWPEGEERPAVADLPFEQLLADLREQSEPPEADALLVVLGDGVPQVAAFHALDQIQQWLLPAVVLTPSQDRLLQRLQASGVIIRPETADPRSIADTLFALTQRQSVVRSLSREVRVATRCSGGVRGEMDRIHDELNLAASIQHEIMPRSLPDIHGLEFGVIFRPVGYVSGDIYDVAQLDDRHVGFLIADAVGHGVPAALMTMVISRSLRLVRAEDGSVISPGEVLTRLNADLMRGRRHSPRFGTAVCGVIDTETMQVSLAAAGHPLPLLVRRGGRIEMVPTEGALLGVFPDEQYSDLRLTLGEDETLVIYSDGLETAFANPLIEQPRVRARVVYHPHIDELRTLKWPDADAGRTLPDSITALERLLDEQSGSLHQADDITAVAVRRVARAPALRAA